MPLSAFFKEKLALLGGLALGCAFLSALLRALGLGGQVIAFLCLVMALCVLLPLGAEYVKRRAFYQHTALLLDELEESYLLPSLLSSPTFWEGEFLRDTAVRLARDMNNQVAAARRESRDYREYVETWVHEIKTPIAAANLLLENHPGPLAQGVGESLFQVEEYVEQALFYARSGAMERDYLVRSMPLEASVRSAVRRYARPLIANRFQLDLGEWTAQVAADPKWVEFILGQLISNAVKYRGQNPLLRFDFQSERDAVRLTVADNGIGIPAADLPRIFDKGFTGANGRSCSARSTGMGLYLCRKLCLGLGLNLTAASRPGEGTQITITFPKGRLHTLSES
ncbi:sensor histidine kinase [Pseudoflavonifractor sp. 524-17]|uniref:sensor histidine kinase n=1 Tax=Pseudoflavonifractor sp. 524-17 TaxID=2304577 RepID=UPI00137B339F|nr:sensor histidine kinase [Pseudoflavonifractor sp. 524-17]NCE64852.1 sensor histidine kinase [Pseudoflavonifractor sp. 524-17]